MPRGSAFGLGLAVACMTAALVAGAAAEARATRDAPPAGHTGGFGEPTCQDCHFEAELNTGGGRLRLEGLPASYMPGAAYTLTVTLAQRELWVGGYQLSVRDAGGAQAGTLSLPDGARRSGITVLGGIAYAHHVLAGTDPVAPDSIGWSVAWTAPAAGGPVVFHVAGNAANGDSSPLGDYVYAIELRLNRRERERER